MDFFGIGPIMGKIMNLIYEGLSLIGIENVGLSIIIFTIIIYTLMLPLTVKQQKFTRLSSAINPEIQEIQKKYQNKKDQDSMMKMQEETKMVYAKYGTSPTGGCLSSLIQLPLLFALYPVVQNVAKYVPSVKKAIAAGNTTINEFLWIENIEEAPSIFFNEAWKAVSSDFSWAAVLSLILAVSIPVLSGLTQWISMKTSQSISQNRNNNAMDQNMGCSMNTMMNVMPLFSVFIGFTLPAGLGIYWIASAVVRTIQQIIINKFLDKKPMDKMVEENLKKAEEKRKKKDAVSSSLLNERASQNTKKTTSNYQGDTYNYNAKAGSLSAKANMVSDYNRRNNKKED